MISYGLMWLEFDRIPIFDIKIKDELFVNNKGSVLDASGIEFWN